MTDVEIAQLVAATVAKTVGDMFGGAMPTNGAHMADTVDNRKWIEAKPTCKGHKKGSTYRLGDKDGIILCSTAPVRCSQFKELNLAGYCSYHADQAGVDESLVKARLAEKPTLVIVPTIEGPALRQVCQKAGLKLQG